MSPGKQPWKGISVRRKRYSGESGALAVAMRDTIRRSLAAPILYMPLSCSWHAHCFNQTMDSITRVPSPKPVGSLGALAP